MRFALYLLITSCFISCRDSGISYEPIPEESGFRMEDYWVWGGSVIKVDSLYHMFASRWIKDRMFPENYRENSEIVRAVANSPMGPYEFIEVVIGERDSAFWDSNMAHNPTIHKIGDEYVLFYIGSDFTTILPGTESLKRRVGYAAASDISGPWMRSDKPLIEDESNNPAILQEAGRIKLVYRDHDLRVYLAGSESYRGPFSIINDNVWPNNRIEDFYLYQKKDRICLVCEDNSGAISGHERWGVELFTQDGGISWNKSDPVVFYDHTLFYPGNYSLLCTRRERPQLLIENGLITYLFTGVFDGKDSWCQPVKLSRPVKTSNLSFSP